MEKFTSENEFEMDSSMMPENASTQDTIVMTAMYRPTEKRRSKKLMAGMLALVMLASCAFGFAGGLASNSLAKGNAVDKEVLYQSVIRNVAADDESAGSPLSSAKVAAAVKDSVVELKTETVSSSRLGQVLRAGAGSGVILTADGYIVTNNHVISNARSVTVRLSNGKEYEASIAGKDSQSDLAILKIEATGLTPAVLGDSSKLSIGDTAIAIGNPLGQLGGTVTEGIISALDRTITMEDGTSMTLLQTDASINPGNSGGGLFNLYGELIGIVNSKSSGVNVEGIGFAIPVNSAKPVIEDIISEGYVKGRVGLGVSVADIQDAFTAMQYQVNQTGLYIAYPGNTSFQAGDRITALGNTSITDLASMKKVLTNYKAGDKVTVTVDRNDKLVTVNHTLVELKS